MLTWLHKKSYAPLQQHHQSIQPFCRVISNAGVQPWLYYLDKKHFCGVDKFSYLLVPLNLFKLDRSRADLQCDVISLPVLPCHLGWEYLIIQQ